MTFNILSVLGEHYHGRNSTLMSSSMCDGNDFPLDSDAALLRGRSGPGLREFE